MYKFGIWQPGDLQRRKTVFGTFRNFAYPLLRTSIPANSEEVERFEAVIRAVRLSAGSCRTTYAGRLSAVDREVDTLAASQFDRMSTIQVCDWGVSDGLVALEWAESTFTRFPNAKFSASDLMLWFTEATHQQGKSYIFEPDGTPLQYIHPPFVVSLAHVERPIYPVNRLVSRQGARIAETLKSRVARLKWKGLPDPNPQVDPPWTFHQIPLIHPRVLNLIVQRPQFTVGIHDAFTPLASPCHILRTMNLFNLAVFGNAKVIQGLRAALDSVEEGGLYILGRTDESKERTNNVSIFRKTAGKFMVLSRLGKGSELEALATAELARF